MNLLQSICTIIIPVALTVRFFPPLSFSQDMRSSCCPCWTRCLRDMVLILSSTFQDAVQRWETVHYKNTTNEIIIKWNKSIWKTSHSVSKFKMKYLFQYIFIIAPLSGHCIATDCQMALPERVHYQHLVQTRSAEQHKRGQRQTIPLLVSCWSDLHSAKNLKT